MGIDEVWAFVKQTAGAAVTPGHALTDHSSGKYFPLNIIKEVLRHPLQGAGVVGKKDNVIPHTDSSKHEPLRDVYLGSHPVGGMISKLIGAVANPTVSVPHSLVSPNPAPDPTHHWAVMVGDYYHELSTDINLKVLYNNGKISEQTFIGGWQKPVYIGKTAFNDEAIRQGSEKVIASMVPDYNVYNNNCQLFCLCLADAICEGGHVKPPASWQLIVGLNSEPAARRSEVSEVSEPADNAWRIMDTHTPRIPPTILA